MNINLYFFLLFREYFIVNAAKLVIVVSYKNKKLYFSIFVQTMSEENGKHWFNSLLFNFLRCFWPSYIWYQVSRLFNIYYLQYIFGSKSWLKGSNSNQNYFILLKGFGLPAKSWYWIYLLSLLVIWLLI